MESLRLMLAIGFTATGLAQAPPPPPFFENQPQSVPQRVGGGVDDRPLARSPVQPSAFVADENLFTLPPPGAADLMQADREAAERYADFSPGPARVGVVRSVQEEAISADIARPTTLDDGRVMYTLAVRSPGSKAIRVRLTGLDLADSKLLVYGLLDGRPVLRGPFTKLGPQSDGEFWTPMLPGDTAYFEVVGDGPPRFDVADIVHFDRSPFAEEDGGSNGNGVFPCHLDAMCEAVNDFARRATGQMSYISGGSSFVCTGTLLNDLDSETVVPYFLTAAHCLSTQSEVNTLDVTWLWQRAGCGGALPNMGDLDVSSGGALVATRAANDFTFIRLNGAAMPGTALAGWTTATGLSNAQGIHHPSGSWKRASFLDGVGACPGCVCVDSFEYDYYNMDNGLVEGGSSGSGVFNSSGQLAGQLRGRCSSCCDPGDMDCSNIDDYWAVYGEFEETHPNIRRWLEIGGTIHVNAANTTPPWDGTPSNPYVLVAQAHALAWNGARIKIQAGVYNEAITLSKRVTLLANGGLVRIGG